MKLAIDAFKLDVLIQRKDDALGEALLADMEALKKISLSPSARELIVRSFEAGYAGALANVVAILECLPPANPPLQANPPVGKAS